VRDGGREWKEDRDVMSSSEVNHSLSFWDRWGRAPNRAKVSTGRERGVRRGDNSNLRGDGLGPDLWLQEPFQEGHSSPNRSWLPLLTG
jgi:hypothetical protein